MINSETLAITYGLGGAMAWGAADFSGGFASRKGNMMAVILLSQLIGGVMLATIAVTCSEAIPAIKQLCYGALAGVCGSLGLTIFYKGLVMGRMGIVAPLSAVLTALVPMGYAAFFQALPSMGQFLGLSLALVAVWLLSSSTNSKLKMTRLELVVSLAAGLGFGLFFVFIDRANDHAVFWPLVAARVASISTLITMMLLGKKRATPLSGQWIFIVLCGLLDACGNALFSMSSHLGRLDIAAVLGSLYPIATVALAWFFFSERLDRKQWAGVALAFVALFFITQ